MKNIDPRLNKAVDVLKFFDFRIRQELKNREKQANNADVETPQSAFEGGQSPPRDIQQPPLV